MWRDSAGACWLSAQVRAVPEKGRANDALVVLLARTLDRPRGTIRLEAGGGNRLKRLRIDNGDDDDLVARLERLVDGT